MIIGICFNTDYEKKDKFGYSCDEYRKDWCGKYDYQGFDSTSMCCVCGGGNVQRKQHEHFMQKNSFLNFLSWEQIRLNLRYISSILAVCECKETVIAPDGSPFPRCSDQPSPACIVVQPSSCSDRQPIHAIQGELVSEEACYEKGNICRT